MLRVGDRHPKEALCQTCFSLAVASASYYGPIWETLLKTGLRWQDVDLDKGILKVQQVVVDLKGRLVIGKPKTKSSRRQITLPSSLVASLREHKARQNEDRLRLGCDWGDHGLMFTGWAGRPIHPHNLRPDFLRWVRSAGVPLQTIHGLRHTYATLALTSGVPVTTVSRQLGHSQVSTTLNVYSHLLPGQDSALAAIMDEVYGRGALVRYS